jgi:hypothetical protein
MLGVRGRRQCAMERVIPGQLSLLGGSSRKMTHFAVAWTQKDALTPGLRSFMRAHQAGLVYPVHVSDPLSCTRIPRIRVSVACWHPNRRAIRDLQSHLEAFKRSSCQRNPAVCVTGELRMRDRNGAVAITRLGRAEVRSCRRAVFCDDSIVLGMPTSTYRRRRFASQPSLLAELRLTPPNRGVPD